MKYALFSIGLAFNTYAVEIDNFQEAKRYLPSINEGIEKEVYCGCNYTKTKIDPSCGILPRKNKTRAYRIEWEHVVPAYTLSKGFECWSKGGRKLCEATNKELNKRYGDLHNLLPSAGELNADRNNYSYGMIDGEERKYGSCDFEVDFTNDLAEPPPNIRGDIARIYFYIIDKYNIQVSERELQLFYRWKDEDPVDSTELLRNNRIRELTGVNNPYVTEVK